MATFTVTTDTEASNVFAGLSVPVLADGDKVYFVGNRTGQPTPYFIAPLGGYQVTKSVEIYGDGPGSDGGDSGTTIHPNNSTNPIFVLVTAPPNDLSNITIRDMKLTHDGKPPAYSPGADAIRCVTSGAGQNVLGGIVLSRLNILNMPGDGIHLEAPNQGPAAIDRPRIEFCEVLLCFGHGLFMKNAVVAYISGSDFSGNRGMATDPLDRSGVFIQLCNGIVLIGTQINRNLQLGDVTDPIIPPYNVVFNVQLRLKGSGVFNLLGCHFEEFDNCVGTPAALTAICVENCNGGEIQGCVFANDTGVSGSRGVFLVNISTGIAIGSNAWGNVDTLIELNPNDGNTGNFIGPQTVWLSPSTQNAILVPDTDGNGNFLFAPTTKSSNVGAGLLLPRTLSTTRDGIPSEYGRKGLLLYNASAGSNKLNVYSGLPVDGGYGWETLVPKIGTDVDRTGLTAAVSPAVNLLGSVPAGAYRVSVTHTVTTAGNAVPLNTTIRWTDENGLRAANPAGPAALLMNIKGGKSGAMILQVAAGSNITYETSLGGAPGIGQYALRIRLESL